jgi:Tfp pilus assembly protein PilN
MVNILPQKIRNDLRVRYYARLFTTLFILSAAAFAVGGGLLIPSYLLAREQADASGRYLTALEERLALEGSAKSGQTLSMLEESVALLKEFGKGPVVSTSLAAIAVALPDGVVLRTMRVTLASKGDGSIIVSGIAETRADLVAYVSTLKESVNFKNVAVPVSDLAADTDLEFTLSFALNIQAP